MAEMLLVDTDILIDAARAVAVALDCLAVAETTHDLAISPITEMELIVGCRDKKELAVLEEALSTFIRIPITAQLAEKATTLRRQFYLTHGLHIPDALIAATAIVGNLKIVSKNQKHFKYLPSIRLQAYPPADHPLPGVDEDSAAD